MDLCRECVVRRKQLVRYSGRSHILEWILHPTTTVNDLEQFLDVIGQWLVTDTVRQMADVTIHFKVLVGVTCILYTTQSLDRCLQRQFVNGCYLVMRQVNV